MNRLKGSASWVLVWGFFLLVGGMILYTGYLGTLYYSSQKSAPIRTNEVLQAVSVRDIIDTHVTVPEVIAPIMQTQTVEMTANNQENVPDRSTKNKKDQEVVKKQNIMDFPCPVKGDPIRSIGNYYSEALENYLFHAGTDYAEPEGTMIRATHGGKVIFSGPDPILGHIVTLDCGEGWQVSYGGLVNLRVQVGESVETKDAIGQVGLFTSVEGESNQPQLHYEVWYGNEVQRPS